MKTKNQSIMWTIAISLVLSLAMAYPCEAGPAARSGGPRGLSKIYHFDVVEFNSDVLGEITIKTANDQLPRYVLVANGLIPDTSYTFGYSTSEDVYPIGSIDTPESGELFLNGTFPLDDVDILQSAEFWIMQTPPTSGNALINGLYLGNYYGWFVTRLACYYSTDGGVTWVESSSTDGITKGNWGRVFLSELGVPYYALVRIHAIVVGGKDRTGSEVFQYSEYACGKDWSWRFGTYYIDGVTWKPVLSYKGLSDINF